MSAGVAINRPQPGSLPLFKKHSDVMPCVSSISTKHPSIQLQTKEQPIESDLDKRLRLALRERDEQWRKHEKAQISFLQQESSNMLRGLHSEIERLGHSLRDAKRQLFVTGGDSVSICDHSELEKTIVSQEDRIRELEQLLRCKEEAAESMESKISSTLEKVQEQINIQADRIRQLSCELNDRNQTVAHLSSQLRSFRLRDAMATAQQRRKASQGSPIVSPSSPHRSFPPKGLLSSSVTVTYPGSRSSLMVESDDENGPGSIERPQRRKSASGFSFGK